MNIVKTFDRAGEFSATRDAEKFLSDRGFSTGSMQMDADRGILFGDFCISKWRGMSKAEINALHGVIRGDGRNGPVTVILFDSAPDDAKAAFAIEVEILEQA